MTRGTRLLFCLIGWLCAGSALAAEPMLVAAGAGYRKPLLELFERFQAETGEKVEGVFGNMQQVETQLKQNDRILLAVGDRAALEPMGLFARYRPLGKGRLTLIAAAGKRPASLKELADAKVRKIGIPNRKAAIFGRAADTCLSRLGLADAVATKLVEVATVPQVATYVATGELDAGFVNLTEALAQKDKIGGWIEAPAECYDPIEISIGELKGRELPPAGRRFLDFLASPQARQILERHGL